MLNIYVIVWNTWQCSRLVLHFLVLWIKPRLKLHVEHIQVAIEQVSRVISILVSLGDVVEDDV